MSEPAEASMCVTRPLLLWFPSLSVCLGYATAHKTMADVDKQRGYKTFIVQVLMHDNNSLVTLLYLIFTYCTAAYTIAMATVPYITKTWMLKKELMFAVIFIFVCNQYA